jgi:hypothetical protein
MPLRTMNHLEILRNILARLSLPFLAQRSKALDYQAKSHDDAVISPRCRDCELPPDRFPQSILLGRMLAELLNRRKLWKI